MDKDSKFSPRTASAVVIANMISTGVFTTLGFQLMGITSGFALIMLWVVGGLAALCGALSYAELGAAPFQSILVFAGGMLALNTFFAVLGLFVLRWRQPDLPRPFRVIFYPFPPLVFLAVVGWTLVHAILNRPTEALFAGGVIASGALFYWASLRVGRTGKETQ